MNQNLNFTGVDLTGSNSEQFCWHSRNIPVGQIGLILFLEVYCFYLPGMLASSSKAQTNLVLRKVFPSCPRTKLEYGDPF